MGRLSIFFRGTDTQFGVFYPKHYLLATFPNLADADRAKLQLSCSGRVDEDLISVSGEEVIDFVHDHSVKHGVWGVVMTAFSRFLGTEASYTALDLLAAKKGAGFLAVRCPTEKVKTAVWRTLEPGHPLVARYYSFGGIEHLAGDN